MTMVPENNGFWQNFRDAYRGGFLRRNIFKRPDEDNSNQILGPDLTGKQKFLNVLTAILAGVGGRGDSYVPPYQRKSMPAPKRVGLPIGSIFNPSAGVQRDEDSYDF